MNKLNQKTGFNNLTISIYDAEPVNYDGLNNAGESCSDCNDGEVYYDIHYGNNLISYPFQNTQYIDDALGSKQKSKDVSDDVALPPATTSPPISLKLHVFSST